MTPDEKILWLLEKGWLFAWGLKHEAFRLLEDTFAGASPDVQTAVLAEMDRSIDSMELVEESPELRAYEKYNLLSMLHHAAPKAVETKVRLDAIRKKYPDFQPREFPDLTHWSSVGWVETDSPVTTGDLLSKPPAEWLELLLTYEGKEFPGPRQGGLLNNLEAAIKKEFAWGERLAKELSELGRFESDLWLLVLRGLFSAATTEEEWNAVLGYAGIPELIAANKDRIADELYSAVRDADNPLPLSTYSRAQEIAQAVWEALQEAEQPESEEEEPDWLFRAINRAGGHIAQFWLHTLSVSRKTSGKKPRQLEEPYRSVFSEMVRSDSYHGEMARIALATQIPFLFWIDEAWTRGNLLPLLDWEQGTKQAQQAWSGFLVWGRWNSDLLPELLPKFVNFAPHVADELGSNQRRYMEFVANMAVYGMDDPLPGLLTPIISAVGNKERESFAFALARQLRDMQGEKKRGLWQRWLKEYWANRNQGIPVPLKPEEVSIMAGWVIQLKPVFAEAVEAFCAGPVPVSRRTDSFSNIEKGDLLETFPEPTARFLVHLSKPESQLEPWHTQHLENLTERLIKVKAPRGLLEQLVENLGQFASPGAQELADLILQ